MFFRDATRHLRSIHDNLFKKKYYQLKFHSGNRRRWVWTIFYVLLFSLACSCPAAKKNMNKQQLKKNLGSISIHCCCPMISYFRNIKKKTIRYSYWKYFLAYWTQRVIWGIVITISALFVKFSHFDLLLQNGVVNLNQTWECSFDDSLQRTDICNQNPQGAE